MTRGKTTPLHTHPNLDETLIVLEGEILFYAEGTEHRVGPRGVAHVLRAIMPQVAIPFISRMSNLPHPTQIRKTNMTDSRHIQTPVRDLQCDSIASVLERRRLWRPKKGPSCTSRRTRADT